jgi:hypothetical protein
VFVYDNFSFLNKSTLRTFLPLLLTLISISGCNQQNSDRIKEFENSLGHDESKALNIIYQAYENFLDSVYPNTSMAEANIKYLSEIAFYGQPRFKFSGDQFVELSKLYMKSGLKSAVGDIADTVWIENDSIYSLYNYHQFPKTTSISFDDYMAGYAPINRVLLADLNFKQRDSLLLYYHESGNFRYSTKFFQALDNAKKNDQFLTEYLYAFEAVGEVSSSLVADGTLSMSPNFSDYFVQRVILVEFFIRFLPMRISLN